MSYLERLRIGPRRAPFVVVLATVLWTGCATAPTAPPSVDVTGLWRGQGQQTAAVYADITLTLEQVGARVTGQFQTSLTGAGGALEGVVSGNEFSYRLLNGRGGADLIVTGDEMAGISTISGAKYRLHRQR